MAAAPDIDHNGLVWRSVSKKPPKHYKVSITSFSSLKSTEKYESGEFEAGGYMWKLVLFPNGNKNREVKDHISLYLELGKQKKIKPGKIVSIDYKLFLLNRHKGKKSYLVLEHSNKKENTYCIYGTIVGGLAGFDRFIPLKDFIDASNGYVIDDTCEFGAEVLVSETTRKSKGECFFMNLNSTGDMYKHVWKVSNFSTLDATKWHFSTPFFFGKQKYCAWRLKLHPNGVQSGKGSRVSVYLSLSKSHELPPGTRILAQVALCISDQIKGSDGNFTPVEAVWFDQRESWRCDQIVTQEQKARMSKDDRCLIVVKISIQGLSMPRTSTRRWPWNFKIIEA
ncbi:hypothetical protein ACLB2K_014476 [Fragaria x ananassa]